MSKHEAIFYQDKTFKRLFTQNDIDNLIPCFWRFAKTKHKQYWVDVPSKPGWIRVFTDWGVVECKRKDPTKGPFL